MQKVLIICGPTGVGKTTLSIDLAKKLHGDILVADSKQVYKGMNIVTGKDIPEDANFVDGTQSYWETKDGVRIWLTDLINPKKDFSVAHWRKCALKVLKVLEREKSLPIIVGGTGLYIKSLSGEIETIGVPPNKSLRAILSGKTKEELYNVLAQMDSVRAASMNNSDRNNPMRLIRAIEIADTGFISRKSQPKTGQPRAEKSKKYDFLKIGLSLPREEIYKRIDLRVDARLKEGAIAETKNLLVNGLKLQDRSMSVFGYKQIGEYLEGKISIEESITRWKNEEHKYALRQMTWFKKVDDIIWFDVGESGWKLELEKKVQNWYNGL